MSWMSEVWQDKRIDGDTVPLLAILLLATALRAIGIPRWSMWLDEIYSATIRSQMALPELLVTPHDPHPPLYFLVVRLWTTVWDTGPVAMRSLSLVFSVAAVYAIYRLGRRLYDSRTGLIAALVLAVSTSQIHFGRNARMYPLVVLLTILSLYYLLELEDGDHRASALYVLSTTALLYTHVYAVFVVLGQNLGLVRRGSVLPDLPAKRWIGLQALLGLLYLPWASVLGRQVLSILGLGSGGTVGIDWIPAASLGLLRNTALLFAGSPWELYPIVTGNPSTVPLAHLILLIGFLAIVQSVVRWGAGSDEHQQDEGLPTVPESRLLVIVFVTIVAVPFVASVLVTPVYFPRFTLPAMVPFVLLVANGVRKIPFPAMRRTILLVLVVASLVLTVTYYEGDSLEPWADGAAAIEEHTDEESVIILQPDWVDGHLQYYYEGPATVLRAGQLEETATGTAGSADSPAHPAFANATRVCVFQYGNPPPTVPESIRSGTFVETGSFEQGVIRTRCYRRNGS